MSISVESDFMMEERTAADITRNLYLSFVIEDEQYAVEISSIKEIIGVVPITVVPQTEKYIKGIINLRGDIIPVIDMRLRFMKPEIEYDDQTCIVVVLYEDYILGLIVDRIIGVYTLEDGMISSPPNSKLSYANQFVKNIGRKDEGIMLLLDLEKILFV
ncbi:MAG: chemotaxis protein CheW [Defluviitaleaceae bacterium]|nr:chemotaxis protein CheW [Defluviitaleaceae bacterium]